MTTAMQAKAIAQRRRDRVAELMAKGLEAPAIAERLGIRRHTAGQLMRDVRAARAELAAAAAKGAA